MFLKDWVVVIGRDAERQRRMLPQRPYSDAYINGLPKKKRKVILSLNTNYSSLRIVNFMCFNN